MIFYRKVLEGFVFFSVFAAVLFWGGNSASAATYALNGWGWAGGTIQGTPGTLGGPGWISFSSKTEEAAGLRSTRLTPYGVYVDSVSGGLSGYAWIGGGGAGWISFETSDVSGCPSGSCSPRIDWVTGSVSGWARVCSVFVSGCSGALLPDSKRGGWEGWISLYGLKLNVPALRFFSYSSCSSCLAWGGGDESGFGWLDMTDVSLTLTSPPPPLTLDFWINGTTNPSITLGQAATFTWSAGPSGITSCTATDGLPPPPAAEGWAGNKSFPSGTESYTPLSAGVYTYRLQCSNGVITTPLRSQTLTVINPVPVINGVCGPANGVPSRSKPSGPALCSVGSPSAVNKNTATNPDQWEWICSGSGGGSDSPLCVAEAKNFFKFIEF